MYTTKQNNTAVGNIRLFGNIRVLVIAALLTALSGAIGKVFSIEPDDTVNANDSREDCGWENIWHGQVQMRPCAMGHSWKKELYAETRLLHPMKRVGEKGAGKGYFVIFCNPTEPMI